MRLSMDLEADLSGLPLDEPVPEDLIPATSNFHKGYFDEIARMIRQERPTLRQLYMRYERGHPLGPRHAAAGGRRDGRMVHHRRGRRVHVHPAPAATGLEDLVHHVVPELQRRGLFRREYQGTTLRDHLGLQRPANRHRGGARGVTA